MSPATPPGPAKLREVAGLFLKLGIIGFGGPAAHIAMMEDEVVRRRGWITREQFLDYVGATNLIPGPNSTELALHIGRARAGWKGLIVAGVCFIGPAMVIVLSLAWAYVRYGALPSTGAVLYGVKPMVIAVVLQALAGLARTALTSRTLVLLAAACVAALLAGLHELVVLAVAGVAAAAPHLSRRALGRAQSAVLLKAPWPAGALLAAGTIASPASLFLTFVKIGSVLFGSGYVLLAFLRTDLVERLRWITERQLLDAVIAGQVTPGPVLTTATFVGYLVHGPSGALAATIGIFLPAFVFVAVSAPLIPRLRASRAAGAGLDGVNVASLAMMAVVTGQLAGSALVDWPTLALGAVGLVLLLAYRLNSASLVLLGAVAGAVLHAAGFAAASR
jgi:chromate transporter